MQGDVSLASAPRAVVGRGADASEKKQRLTSQLNIDHYGTEPGLGGFFQFHSQLKGRICREIIEL